MKCQISALNLLFTERIGLYKSQVMLEITLNRPHPPARCTSSFCADHFRTAQAFFSICVTLGLYDEHKKSEHNHMFFLFLSTSCEGN